MNATDYHAFTITGTRQSSLHFQSGSESPQWQPTVRVLPLGTEPHHQTPHERPRRRRQARELRRRVSRIVSPSPSVPRGWRQEPTGNNRGDGASIFGAPAARRARLHMGALKPWVATRQVRLGWVGAWVVTCTAAALRGRRSMGHASISLTAPQWRAVQCRAAGRRPVPSRPDSRASEDRGTGQRAR